MKADLDKIMEERNLDALLVMGDTGGNKVMHYLTNGAPLERALVVKRRGGPLVLIHGSMERDTALSTGLELVDRDQRYNRYELLNRHNGDRLAAEVDYLMQVIDDQGLQGRLGIYGMQDAGAAFALLTKVQALADNVELVGEYEESLFSIARETKDNAEIAEMKEAGRLTTVIMGETRDFLQEHNVQDKVLMKSSKEALTIGDVRQFIHDRLNHYGMAEDHDTIFSQGRDAGVPHNRGDDGKPVKLGEPIVFDFFPMTESGYFHDVTRTWCLGYAPPEVQQVWDECKEIFDKVISEMKVGTPCRLYQEMTCDYFEEKGHPTVRTAPGTHEGYVHSLGHGLGLDVHEEPRLSHAAGNDTLLQPGHVVSVEPGLYYPERGIGVRIEDTVAFDEDGKLVNLTNFPYDLVIPMG